MPKFAIPDIAALPKLPKALPTPPNPMLPNPDVTALPRPPNTPPKAVPIPGTNTARGATFLTTLPMPLAIFFKKPCCSKPVDASRDAIPVP